MQEKMYTETSLRSKLYRRGYHLVKCRDGWGAEGYMIADNCRYLVYGGEMALMSLDDIAEWIKWFDAQNKVAAE